ncbi:S-formylglutathione hydrolase [hydrothermal vent metagenome]|uniref:S-formylglutathione hydrolase n=1 Tax=hydrothermal vent metagenome TaxID=652676 RepID=A0A3B1DH49_9ZZZZ
MITLIKKNKCFDGFVEYYEHDSFSTQTQMKFSVFVPANNKKSPVLFWLSGLTCTEENFMAKAGVQQFANREGIIIVCPDTSPRGTNIKGEHDHWDFGSGAGFYVNATTELWKQNYRMYDYIVNELPELIASNFSADLLRLSIFGHSMGGHGALTIALRNPKMFKSVSALAPICAPMQCAWGQKAFTHYLGKDSNDWTNYDASELIKLAQIHVPILIDQGTDDEFLKEQLKTSVFENICKTAKYNVNIRFQKGYDHSFYFISSFIEDHINFHAKYLYGN